MSLKSTFVPHFAEVACDTRKKEKNIDVASYSPLELSHMVFLLVDTVTLEADRVSNEHSLTSTELVFYR